jgi:hypothetical protein
MVSADKRNVLGIRQHEQQVNGQFQYELALFDTQTGREEARATAPTSPGFFVFWQGRLLDGFGGLSFRVINMKTGKVELTRPCRPFNYGGPPPP